MTTYEKQMIHFTLVKSINHETQSADTFFFHLCIHKSIFGVMSSCVVTHLFYVHKMIQLLKEKLKIFVL